MPRKFSSKISDLLNKYFDISKYDKCQELDIVGWYNALSFRFTLRPFVGPKANADGRRNYGAETIPQILSDPLPRTEWDEPILGKPQFRSVTDLQVIDYWYGADCLDPFPDAREACEELDRQREGGDWDRPSPKLTYASYHSLCIDRGIYSGSVHEAHVSVDLHATDEQLETEFAEWLAAKREELKATEVRFSRKRMFDERDTRDWTAKRVLAYIDIDLVSKHLGTRIPYHIFGDLLFPDVTDIDVTEKVRKVVRPLADFLMDGETMSALQIAASRASRKKRNINARI